MKIESGYLSDFVFFGISPRKMAPSPRQPPLRSLLKLKPLQYSLVTSRGSNTLYFCGEIFAKKIALWGR